jgi:hypothetical protein
MSNTTSANNMAVGNALSVAGVTTLNGPITSSSSGTFGGGLSTTTLNLTNNLNQTSGSISSGSGGITSNGNLAVEGTSVFSSNITSNANIVMNGNIICNSTNISPSELACLDGSTQNVNTAVVALQNKTQYLTLSGITNTFGGHVIVDGNLSCLGNATVSGLNAQNTTTALLTVTGSTNFQAVSSTNLSASGTLNVTGLSTLGPINAQNITTTGSMIFGSSGLSGTGNASLSGDLNCKDVYTGVITASSMTTNLLQCGLSGDVFNIRFYNLNNLTSANTIGNRWDGSGFYLMHSSSLTGTYDEVAYCWNPSISLFTVYTALTSDGLLTANSGITSLNLITGNNGLSITSGSTTLQDVNATTISTPSLQTYGNSLSITYAPYSTTASNGLAYTYLIGPHFSNNLISFSCPMSIHLSGPPSSSVLTWTFNSCTCTLNKNGVFYAFVPVTFNNNFIGVKQQGNQNVGSTFTLDAYITNINGSFSIGDYSTTDTYTLLFTFSLSQTGTISSCFPIVNTTITGFQKTGNINTFGSSGAGTGYTATNTSQSYFNTGIQKGSVQVNDFISNGSITCYNSINTPVLNIGGSNVATTIAGLNTSINSINSSITNLNNLTTAGQCLYDSGYFAISKGQTFPFIHNCGFTPDNLPRISIWFRTADTSGSDLFGVVDITSQGINWNNSDGYGVYHVSGNELFITAGNSTVAHFYVGTGGAGPQSYSSGYYRFKLFAF